MVDVTDDCDPSSEIACTLDVSGNEPVDGKEDVDTSTETTVDCPSACKTIQAAINNAADGGFIDNLRASDTGRRD